MFQILKVAVPPAIVVGYGAWKLRNLGVLQEVSEDEVIWAWLKENVNHPTLKFRQAYNKVDNWNKTTLLCNPSFIHPEENQKRRKIFSELKELHSFPFPGSGDPHTGWFKRKILINPFKNKHGFANNIKCMDPFISADAQYETENLNNIVMYAIYPKGDYTIIAGGNRWNSRMRWMPYISTVYIAREGTCELTHGSNWVDL